MTSHHDGNFDLIETGAFRWTERTESNILFEIRRVVRTDNLTVPHLDPRPLIEFDVVSAGNNSATRR
jgi:hypothetical protein